MWGRDSKQEPKDGGTVGLRRREPLRGRRRDGGRGRNLLRRLFKHNPKDGGSKTVGASTRQDGGTEGRWEGFTPCGGRVGEWFFRVFFGRYAHFFWVCVSDFKPRINPDAREGTANASETKNHETTRFSFLRRF